jgi:hypothetical protein
MSESVIPQEGGFGLGGKRDRCWKIRACALVLFFVELWLDRVSCPASERSEYENAGEAQQPEDYPYVFVPTDRYDYIKNVLRPKGRWTFTDARFKVVNNFRRQFNKILRRVGVKKGTFHDFRRTAISMWFANGMSEHDVMVLAGHASFATTHEFYLVVADDLIHRARAATAQGLRQKLVNSGADAL